MDTLFRWVRPGFAQAIETESRSNPVASNRPYCRQNGSDRFVGRFSRMRQSVLNLNLIRTHCHCLEDSRKDPLSVCDCPSAECLA